MPRALASFILGLSTLLFWAMPAFADQTSLSYYRAKIVATAAQSDSSSQAAISIQILNGPDTGKIVSAGTVGFNSSSDLTMPIYHTGDIVVIVRTPSIDKPGGPTYSVLDHYRLPTAGLLLSIVIVLAVIFAGWRGLGSIIGLAISLAVIGGFVVPQILQGRNPYPIALGGSFIIAGLGIYFAHGFSRRTTLALISTYLTLLLAAGVSILAVSAAHLNGIATEDTSYLHQQVPNLNLQGLLLGGIMIGVLGVLDDITVGQAAIVEQLHHASPSLNWRELYRRAMKVGREHISSLINTLVLAYAGTSLIFIVYVAAVLNLPLWFTLNSELVMEEIVRSLIGSLALILAVPIATLLAGYFLPKYPPTSK